MYILLFQQYIHTLMHTFVLFFSYKSYLNQIHRINRVCVNVCVNMSGCFVYIHIFFLFLLFWLLALVEYNLKRFSFRFMFYNLNYCFVNFDRLLNYVVFINVYKVRQFLFLRK